MSEMFKLVAEYPCRYLGVNDSKMRSEEFEPWSGRGIEVVADSHMQDDESESPRSVSRKRLLDDDPDSQIHLLRLNIHQHTPHRQIGVIREPIPSPSLTGLKLARLLIHLDP